MATNTPLEATADTAATVPDNEKTVTHPVRFGVAVFLGTVMWVAPFLGLNTVLLPARLAEIAPDQKVALVSTLAVVGSIVALVANILFGAFSDLTRSRFGRRNPWLVMGSVGTFLAVMLLMQASSVATIVAAWCLFQMFLNALVAPLVTVIPDRVPVTQRGSYSAVYGVAMMVGASSGQLLASRFVTDTTTGMWVMAIILLLDAPVFWLLAPEQSNKDHPRAPFSASMLVENFVFPVRNCRDFYLALSGKLLCVLGMFAITGYQLYILTDYMKQSTEQAGDLIAVISMITLATGLVFGTISGPLSDRLGRRRKVFVIGATWLIAVAALFPFVVARPWAMLVYAALAGIGQGVYNSVDQALNYEVLPNPGTAAKDLGILNMANTGGQILAPAVTGGIVAAFAGYGPVFLASAAIMVASSLLIAPIKKAR
ncbi:MAG: MFS transporter [Actinomyces sp.]|jgi:MFS family permease|nr:MFS transporter [Actinomyces sp.]MCI1691673.1 MFS transporter [Actinomyces sp.]MCI1788001.1 MFS transporter [Actinomyces sp.]MCI1830550.1 MFS transporter [Actinomyces sp.]